MNCNNVFSAVCSVVFQDNGRLLRNEASFYLNFFVQDEANFLLALLNAFLAFGLDERVYNLLTIALCGASPARCSSVRPHLDDRVRVVPHLYNDLDVTKNKVGKNRLVNHHNNNKFTKNLDYFQVPSKH